MGSRWCFGVEILNYTKQIWKLQSFCLGFPLFQVKELETFRCRGFSLCRSLLWASSILSTCVQRLTQKHWPQHIFHQRTQIKGKWKKKNPKSVYSQRSQQTRWEKQEKCPVSWDGSYLYQFSVAIWRSYKMQWLVSRKIITAVKWLPILFMMFADEDQNIYIFFWETVIKHHASLKVSLRTVSVKYPWQANSEHSPCMHQTAGSKRWQWTPDRTGG